MQSTERYVPLDLDVIRDNEVRLIELLRSHGVNVNSTNSIRCPFHGGENGDKDPSAEIRRYPGAWRFKCHAAGCEICEDFFGVLAKFRNCTNDEAIADYRREHADAAKKPGTSPWSAKKQEQYPNPDRRDQPSQASAPRYTYGSAKNQKPGYAYCNETGKDVRVFESIDAWRQFYERGRKVTDYSDGYADPRTGELKFLKLRVEPGFGKNEDGSPEKKSFVTAHVAADGKVYGFWPSQKYPLYLNAEARPHFAKHGNFDSVVMVEGEKAADAMNDVGEPAVSVPLGAKTSMDNKALDALDWSPLTRAAVMFWPDHDPIKEHTIGRDDKGKEIKVTGRAGRIFMKRLVEYLEKNHDCIPYWIDTDKITPEMPAKGDAADVVKRINPIEGEDPRAASRSAIKAILKLAQPAIGNSCDAAARGPTNETQPAMIEVGETTPMEESDMRAAQLVRQQFGENIRYQYERKQWMVYNHGVWKCDVMGFVPQCVKQIASQSLDRLSSAGVRDADKVSRSLQSGKGVASVMTLLQSEPGMSVISSWFDRDNFLLNCQNGTVDLRSGQLKPHDRFDYCTKIVPIFYDADAPRPLWESHLKRIFPGDSAKVAYLKRLFGYFATGDISVEEFYVFHGDGANGKSKTVEMLQHCLGEYAGVAPESLIMMRKSGPEHPTELADLKGKRFVVLSESESSGTLALQRIKRLTGDSVIKARWMRGDFFEFARTHKMVLLTNHRPRVNESSEAAWRRIRLFPFDHTIPKTERDDKIIEKFQAEASGILSWIVEGSVERLKHGLEPPTSVSAATDEYRNDSDAFGRFLADEVEFEASGRVTRDELCAAYRNWAGRTEGSEELNNNKIYERIRGIPGVKDGQWKHERTPVRGFNGIRLRFAQAQSMRLAS
jgi:putative DNA primase/helicase